MKKLNKQKIHSQDLLYLTIDQGGHASRAIVYDQVGVVVSSSICKIDTLQQGNRVEHDATQFIDSITTVIHDALSQLGDKISNVHCAGLATQRSSIIAWDCATNEVLSPVISWQDRRGTEFLALIEGFTEQTRKTTGLFPNAHYGATKIRWCLQNIAGVKTALAKNKLRIAPVASFILNQLLVERPYVIDPSNGSRTMLLDVSAGRWSQDLLTRFTVPIEILPQYVPTRWNFGHIAYADRLIPLHICTGDQAAAFFVTKEPDRQAIYVNAGTGVFIQKLFAVATETPPARLLQSIVYQDKKKSLSLIEGTVNGAGRALQWFADQARIKNLDQKLIEWERSIKDPPLFFNGISGVGSPFWVAELQSQFSRPASTPEKAVAILESIVFLCLENILRISGGDHIIVSGGLSLNEGFCQRLANLAGIVVIRTCYAEATSLGLLNLLLHRQGGSEHVFAEGLRFMPERDLALRQRFDLWRSEFNSLILIAITGSSP